MERLKLDIQKFASVQSDSYEGRYLKLTVEETGTDISTNTSTVKWTLESIGGSSNYYTISNCYVSMTYAKNSADTTVTENVVWYGTVYWSDYRFPASTGSVSGTITVKHKNDGTALPVNFTLHGRVWYDGDDNRSSSINLTTIPRYTTVTTWSVKSKNETSITMSWKTAENVSAIKYGINTSSPTTESNLNKNSGEITISGLNVGQTYTLYFMPQRKDSGLWGDGSNNTWKSLANQSTNEYPHIVNPPTFKIGDQPVMNLYNPSNRACTIYLIGNDNSTIYTGTREINGNTTLYPDASEITAMYQSIPDNYTGNYKIRLVCSALGRDTTVNGNTYSVNGTEVPIFNDFDYEDTNATTLALTGDSSKIIQNYSTLTATVSVANKAEPDPDYYASRITKYNLIIGNQTNSENYSSSSPVSVSIANVSGNTMTLYAEDIRGLTKGVPKTIPAADFIAYTNIQKGNINITRASNVGEAVTLTFNGTFWNNSFGSQNNDLTVSYKFKKTTDNSWTIGQTSITPTTTQGSNDYLFNGGILGDTGTGFDTQYSYNIEVTVSDKLSSTTFTFVLGTGIPTIAVADNGVAIKQSYDTNDSSVLQVNGNTKSTSYNGYVIDLQTDDTTNTWVPVLDNGTLKHRVIPKMYNTSTPAIKMECIDGRIANADIAHTYENSRSHVQLLQASSSMTSNKPASDGYILHFSWDNTAKCDGQFFVPNEAKSTVQYRQANDSGTWGSWENLYRGKSLYDNASGTQGTVSLSETTANFTFLQIHYRIMDDQNYVKSVIIYSPNGKRTALDYTNSDNAGNGWLKNKEINISGTSIAVNSNIEATLRGGTTTNTDRIYITKVIGYR